LSQALRHPRTTISAYLRLLGLDEEVRTEALNLSVEDERVAGSPRPVSDTSWASSQQSN